MTQTKKETVMVYHFSKRNPLDLQGELLRVSSAEDLSSRLKKDNYSTLYFMERSRFFDQGEVVRKLNLDEIRSLDLDFFTTGRPDCTRFLYVS